MKKVSKYMTLLLASMTFFEIIVSGSNGGNRKKGLCAANKGIDETGYVEPVLITRNNAQLYNQPTITLKYIQ